MKTVRGQNSDRTSQYRGKLDRLELSRQRLTEELANLPIVDNAKQMRQHANKTICNSISNFRGGEPVGKFARNIDRTQLCPDQVRREKIAFDESGQPLA